LCSRSYHLEDGHMSDQIVSVVAI